MIGVFAPPGTHIPGTGIDLQRGVIRGVELNGMLLSARELGISDDHAGIVDLPADAPVGAAYAAWAGLDDPVIDVAVTPNRPDALGVHGIARDLDAAGIGRLIEKPVERVRGAFNCPVNVTLDFGETASLCPAFGLRLVRGVRNGPLARMAAEAAPRDRASPDQCAGRHHQFHDLRRQPAAPRLRRRQGQGQPHRPPRPCRRGDRGARRQDLCPRRDDVRHRRRGRRRIDRRHHGRRRHRLHRGDHRRADRIGALGAAQHRPDRPQARHPVRRPPPLRARRRSGLHAARPRYSPPA